MAKRFGSEDGVITPYEEKRGKAIAKATGNTYSVGGGAGQTTREKEKFQLDKNIKKVKEKMSGKGLKLSDSEKKQIEERKTKLAKGGRAKNTRRMNRLEELGRVDAEKAYTKKGKRNLKAEKKRIVRSLNSRGAAVRGHGKEIK